MENLDDKISREKMELIRCIDTAKYARTNPDGWTFCDYNPKVFCPYRFLDEKDSKYHCSKWHK